MNDVSPDPEGCPPKARYRRLVKIALIVAAVLAAAAALLLIRRQDVARKRETARRVAAAKDDIARQVAEIRARGEPTSLVEAAPPPAPDAENAAVIFEKVFAVMAANEARENSDPAIRDWCEVLYDDGEPFEPHKTELVNVLALYAEAMRLAREAMKRPRCRFDLDYAAGPAMLMPHLARLRHLARLFWGEALLKAHNGLPGEAAASMGNMFGLARAFDEEPSIISKLLEIAINGIGLKALKRIEREAPLSDPARREVLKHLGKLEARGPVTKGLVGERGAFHGYMQTLMSEGRIPGIDDPDLQRAMESNPHMFVEDNARLVREMTKAIDASRLPPWKALLKFKLIETRLGSFSPEEAPLSAQLFPALCAAHLRGVRLTAKRDVAVIGLACKLYKSRHGRYPDKLDALAPEFLKELPPDPFTGKPFVYRREGEGDAAGFVVYSVGDNLTDDGGAGRSEGKDDIAWEGGRDK